MKKIFILTLLLIVIITGCRKEIENVPREKYEGDTAKNVTMKIKEGTLTNESATVIIEDLSGKNNTYGEEFRLYKKIGNDWIYLYPKVDNLMWNLIGYGVNENNILELKTSWHCYWGKLSPGEYKLVKDAVPEDENANYTFSVDFTI